MAASNHDVSQVVIASTGKALRPCARRLHRLFETCGRMAWFLLLRLEYALLRRKIHPRGGQLDRSPSPPQLVSRRCDTLAQRRHTLLRAIGGRVCRTHASRRARGTARRILDPCNHGPRVSGKSARYSIGYSSPKQVHPRQFILAATSAASNRCPSQGYTTQQQLETKSVGERIRGGRCAAVEKC